MDNNQRSQYLMIAIVVVGVIVVAIGLRTWKTKRDAELKKMHSIEIRVPAGFGEE